MKHDRQLVSAEEQAAQQADPVNSLKHVSEDTKRVMAKLNSADSATVSRLSLLSLVMHEDKVECLEHVKKCVFKNIGEVVKECNEIKFCCAVLLQD